MWTLTHKHIIIYCIYITYNIHIYNIIYTHNIYVYVFIVGGMKGNGRSDVNHTLIKTFKMKAKQQKTENKDIHNV